ncbi:MAG TPA: glycoside hydrolase domain-containing protein, partial [Nocardioidaceae bacterium]|nr:glycoside hydrolase domain-containing protein [Nocardioidaceae bacterium]
MPQRARLLSRSLATAVTAAVTASLLAAVPAEGEVHTDVRLAPSTSTARAKPVVVPGRFTGLGFDACSAPDQSTMDELRFESPYWGVGVYIGGPERTCSQPALDAAWVRTQAARGWHVFPVWVGRQSQCSDRSFVTQISARNAKATAQGVASANDAVRTAKRLGIGKGSTLFLDVEAYDNTTSACNQPVLSYQSGWNSRLRKLGWKGGFYSAGSSGIASIGFIKQTQPDAYSLPTAIWISSADGKPTTDVPRFIDNGLWRHQRMHQYRIDVTRSFGAATLQLDENAIDIGGGAKPGPPGSDCHGVPLSFVRYPLLHRGASRPEVKAVQCLLKQRGLYRPQLTQSYGAATARGVGQFQRRHGLATTKSVNAATWTALLSSGGTPLSKRGSTGDRVRAIQRAIAAAMGRRLNANGVFTAETQADVAAYQKRLSLDVARGIVGPATWKALQAGRVR